MPHSRESKPAAAPQPVGAAGNGHELPTVSAGSLLGSWLPAILIATCLGAVLAVGWAQLGPGPADLAHRDLDLQTIDRRARALVGEPAQVQTTLAAPTPAEAWLAQSSFELPELQRLDAQGDLQARGDASTDYGVWPPAGESNERDGESAFPAGTGQPAPFESEAGRPRAPLKRYDGDSVVLWTDTKSEYATELLVRLDHFLSQAHAEMARVLQVESKPKPVQIYVFESQERYQDYAREHAPGLVNNGGFYDGGLRTVVTYRYNNSMQLYFHELVHAMMGELFQDHHFTRYTKRNWPIWFDEGISEYLGSFELLGGQVHIPALNKGKLAYLANAMNNRVFIDIPALLRAPAERFSGSSMNIYYAESWGLLQFLLASPTTRPKVAQFFRQIRNGEDGLQAFKACFGDDTAGLSEAWKSHIYNLTRTEPGAQALFSGDTIDDWTIHEGGHWRAGGGEISGQGDRNYNYLIKSELPVTDFAYELDVKLQRGTAGLILGNNFHGEYPYYYLIEVARDVVMVRRAWSASQIEPVIQAYADVPQGEWVHVRVAVSDRVLRLTVGGRQVLQTRVDRDRYSLFGLYLYRAKVQFRNIVLLRDGPRQFTATPATPAGGPAEAKPGP